MPSRIDQNLLPPVIREAVDPDILNRAQSIEWSIARDTGVDEHGYLDGTDQDQYLSGPQKTVRGLPPIQSRKSRKVDWLETSSGRDSGFDYTPTSPNLNQSSYQTNTTTTDTKRSVTSLSNEQQRVDMSPLEDSLDFGATNRTNASGQMKRFPQGQYPFPIYKVNQEQLEGDVVFEAAPRAKPGERTVHYEKSSKVLNEDEMNALGLNPNVFGPNTQTMVDDQEEETIETSVLKGGRRELEDLYNEMRIDKDGYFDRQRARSVSPNGSRYPIEQESSEHKKTVIFGSVDEINREQEFYPYRDAHQGKPLPGDNEYGTWGSRFDDQKQWKLCNGQWVRVAEPKPKPKAEKYLAETVKCKPPVKEVARARPIRQIEPQSGSTDNSDTDSDSDSGADSDLDRDRSPPFVDLDSARRRSPPRRQQQEPAAAVAIRPSYLDDVEPVARRPIRSRPLLEEPDVDLDALADKYRPKKGASPPAASQPAADDDNDDTNAKPTGTILLEPIRPPTPPLEEIKVEPVKPTYVEVKKPLKQPEGEEEKMMEDPNLMWMQMGPAQYGPPFGSMKRRKAREEEWVGPPCELCHKQIEERRCMLAENMKFHCWHFACSFCLKTLKPADFLIAEADRKPYCLNCHKREFPEISLVNLHLEE